MRLVFVEGGSTPVRSMRQSRAVASVSGHSLSPTGREWREGPLSSFQPRIGLS